MSGVFNVGNVVVKPYGSLSTVATSVGPCSEVVDEGPKNEGAVAAGAEGDGLKKNDGDVVVGCFCSWCVPNNDDQSGEELGVDVNDAKGLLCADDANGPEWNGLVWADVAGAGAAVNDAKGLLWDVAGVGANDAKGLLWAVLGVGANDAKGLLWNVLGAGVGANDAKGLVWDMAGAGAAVNDAKGLLWDVAGAGACTLELKNPLLSLLDENGVDVDQKELLAPVDVGPF